MTTEKFKIEKNIPRKRKGKEIYPFAKMEVDDSFFVAAEEGKDISSLRSTIHTQANSYCKWNKKDWKFTTATEGQGIRIWRVS